MDDGIFYPYGHRHDYTFYPRNAYYIPRPYFSDLFVREGYNYEYGFPKMPHEDDETIRSPNNAHLRHIAYFQIFVAGVLLLSDVSKIVLLWNEFDVPGSKVQMIAQLVFPLFSLVIGFLSLHVAFAPTPVTVRLLIVLLVAATIPAFVQPKSAVMITATLEAVEVSRASSKAAWKTPNSNMIKSEAQNRLSRILAVSTHSGHIALGVKDLSSLPVDLLFIIQYLLVTFAMFALLQLIIYGVLIVLLVRVLRDV